jgi:hypothetical protein
MVGMFTTTPCGHTYILVAVDKFIKWVEARPIADVSGETATHFVMDILIRYGLPRSIITDNGNDLTQGELKQVLQSHVYSTRCSICHAPSAQLTSRAHERFGPTWHTTPARNSSALCSRGLDGIIFGFSLDHMNKSKQVYLPGTLNSLWSMDKKQFCRLTSPMILLRLPSSKN